MWVFLWSQSQCAFHVERLEDMLDANALAFREDRRMDYVPLFVGTESECQAAADAARPILRERQEARDAAREAMDKARYD